MDSGVAVSVLGVGVYLRVGHVKPGSGGYADMNANLDMGTTMH